MENKIIAISNSDVFYQCLNITEYMWNRNRHIPTLREMFDNAYEFYLDLYVGESDQYIDALQNELDNVTDYYDKKQVEEYINFVKKVSGNVDDYEEE